MMPSALPQTIKVGAAMRWMRGLSPCRGSARRICRCRPAPRRIAPGSRPARAASSGQREEALRRLAGGIGEQRRPAPLFGHDHPVLHRMIVAPQPDRIDQHQPRRPISARRRRSRRRPGRRRNGRRPRAPRARAGRTARRNRRSGRSQLSMRVRRLGIAAARAGMLRRIDRVAARRDARRRRGRARRPHGPCR